MIQYFDDSIFWWFNILMIQHFDKILLLKFTFHWQNLLQDLILCLNKLVSYHLQLDNIQIVIKFTRVIVSESIVMGFACIFGFGLFLFCVFWCLILFDILSVLAQRKKDAPPPPPPILNSLSQSSPHLNAHNNKKYSSSNPMLHIHIGSSVAQC